MPKSDNLFVYDATFFTKISKNALPKMSVPKCPSQNALPKMPLTKCPSQNALPKALSKNALSKCHLIMPWKSIKVPIGDLQLDALPCPSEPQYDIVKHGRACPSNHYFYL